MHPFYRVFGSKGCLVYLSGRRHGSDAAEQYALNAECIAGAKHTTYIMHGTHIIEHYRERSLGCLTIGIQ